MDETPRAIDDVTGTHCIADLYDCSCDLNSLTDSCASQEFILDRIQEAGFTALHVLFHKFPEMPAGTPSGYTGMVVLGESHFAIHTWAVERVVQLCLFTCNVSKDNSEATVKCFQDIVEWFQPRDANIKTINRGRKV